MGAINHIYLNGVRVAAIAPTSSDTPAIRYYLGDQVNSVKVILDGQRNVLAGHEYLPYGEEFSHSPRSGEGDGGKFNAQERDEESGLDFFNARHYDSEIARFVSADTVIDGEDFLQGWNRYMYGHGNPLGYTDPTGNGRIYYLFTHDPIVDGPPERVDTGIPMENIMIAAMYSSGALLTL
jgi:RHS repeat-associated protein